MKICKDVLIFGYFMFYVFERCWFEEKIGFKIEWNITNINNGRSRKTWWKYPFVKELRIVKELALRDQSNNEIDDKIT